MKKSENAQIWLFLVTVLFLLAACGGSVDEAVEDTSDTDTSAVDDTTDSEAIEDGELEATGSEKDSGELPPTPNPGNKTDAPRATPALIANVDTAVATQTPPPNRSETTENTPVSQLDLVLLIDATGSMTQELDQLQANLETIRGQLPSEAENITLRFGFVAFRDQGKGDAIELFSLTDSWALFAENLRSVTAVGGGDYPEDLNAALYQAVNGMNWRPEAQRLIILLSDAPPHLDDEASGQVEALLQLAAQPNMTIFTVGSDGLNEAGVDIYQQIAAAGSGRFVFLSSNPAQAPANALTVQPLANLADVLLTIISEVLRG